MPVQVSISLNSSSLHKLNKVKNSPKNKAKVCNIPKHTKSQVSNSINASESLNYILIMQVSCNTFPLENLVTW